MEFNNYDFHCHSNASDGELAPIELLKQAEERGIESLALTDHDTIAGYLSLVAENIDSSVCLYAGAEFTARHNKQVVHIVGLNIDTEHDALSNYLRLLDRLRRDRACSIGQKLLKAGLPDVTDMAFEIAGEYSVGRPHFAKALVKMGVVETESEAFDRYLGRKKVGDVKADWPELSEVLSLIKSLNGISILAHPTKYKLTATRLRKLLVDFASLGGCAVELSYPGIDRQQQAWLDRVLSEIGLSVSGGSDFHREGFVWQQLGRFPEYKSINPHVLSLLKGEKRTEV